MRAGEKVLVREEVNKMWVRAESVATGQSGLVPKAFLNFPERPGQPSSPAPATAAATTTTTPGPPPAFPPPELPSELLNISANPETEPYAISKFPFKVIIPPLCSSRS